MLQEALETSGVPLPVLRDLEGNQGKVFHTVAVPATFIIDGRGVLQDYEFGDNEKLLTVLPAKLEKVLAGEAIYQQPLEAYQKELAEYEKILNAPEVPAPPDRPVGAEQKIPIPHAELAPRSPPRVFQLTPLWTCTELNAPSNVLVVPSADGPPRILVVDAWKSVAEVGTDGKVIASHALKIEETEFINVLHTATTPEGKRFFVALALFTGQQRCHLLDENLDLLSSYPQDALENPHSGIADAHLADLDGDGKLELCVGYWGVVGVKTASLDGKPIGANRTSVVNVQRIAFSAPDARGRRRLLCANTSDALAVLDAQCRPQGTVVIPGRFLRNIVSADLDADGTPEWCGLAGVKVGDNLAVGLDLSGKELWTYPLPEGVHQLPVERIIPARLTTDGPGQWLLPGPDGSIHVLAADGKPLDRLNYGAALAGLATAVIDGKPVLLVSSPNGVEALTVQ